MGNAPPPMLLSPRRQEWDDKGKALGVAKGIVTRRAETNLFGSVSVANRARPVGLPKLVLKEW